MDSRRILFWLFVTAVTLTVTVMSFSLIAYEQDVTGILVIAFLLVYLPVTYKLDQIVYGGR